MSTSDPVRTPESNRTSRRSPTASAISGQGVQRGDGAVDLAAAVVGDDDSVHARVGGLARVVRVQDALEHDRPVPVLPQEGQLIPGVVGAGEHRHPAQHRRDQVVLGRLLQPREEGRVGEGDGGADAAQEGQVGLVQVLGAPGEGPGVQGDDEVGEPGRAGALQDADADLVVVRPVELEPARRRRPFASATSSMVCEEAVESTIGRPSAAAARAVASSPSGWMIDCTPTGASSTGAGIRVPSTVVLRSRPSAPRSMRGHQTVPLESLAVGAVRRAGPRRPGEIAESARVEVFARGGAEEGEICGEGRQPVESCLAIVSVLFTPKIKRVASKIK